MTDEVKVAIAMAYDTSAGCTQDKVARVLAAEVRRLHAALDGELMRSKVLASELHAVRLSREQLAGCSDENVHLDELVSQLTEELRRVRDAQQGGPCETCQHGSAMHEADYCYVLGDDAQRKTNGGCYAWEKRA
jgi:outer membrane murein-binding lipoprotein Lpp